ncbi:MAG: hypothetical protein CMJ94_06830 [Planctomycetes bacterium]|nr:hypothetical protein [Planctomycetota bacterium]
MIPPIPARVLRWGLAIGLVAALGAVGIRMKYGSGLQVIDDPTARVTTLLSPADSLATSAGWVPDHDRDGIADIGVSWERPGGLILWRSLIKWRRTYTPPAPMVAVLSSTTGSALRESSYAAGTQRFAHRDAGGRICFHVGPSLDPDGTVLGGSRCIGHSSDSYIFPSEEAGTLVQLTVSRRGAYFRVQDLNSGEDLRVEELGDHASLHTWPELTANGRVLLNYGERESWSELSEVKPDGSGRRWPFWAKEHGLPGYGELTVLRARVLPDQRLEAIVLWRVDTEFFPLRLLLGDAEQVEVERISPAQTQSGTLAQVAVAWAEFLGDDFAFFQVRRAPGAPHQLLVDVRLPGCALETAPLPVTEEDIAKQPRLLGSVLRVSSSRGAFFLDVTRIPDLNGDHIDEWRMMIHMWGFERHALVLADLDGSTGTVLPR